MLRTIVLAPLSALLAITAAAQALPPAELGTPPLVHYDIRDYRHHPQNWAVLQGDDGVMYFGNSDGVLSFDGEHWELTPLPNGSIVRSLAKGADGTIWVGGVGELGYLAPAEPGADPPGGARRLSYRSLIDRLPPARRPLPDVWRTYATPDGVYFQAGADTLLRWSDGAFRAWRLGGERQFLLEADGRILFNRDGVGLVELVADLFEPVPGGGEVEGLRLVAALPDGTGDGSLLLVTREQGVLRFRPGRGATPFPTEVDDRLRVHRIYHAQRLDDGALALATMSGGAFVVDGAGRLVHALDQSSGLPDDSVWFVGTDSEGGLWLALDRGLARADVRSPCTVFDETRGLDTTVEALARFDGTLYAATRVGLMTLRGGRFEPLDELRHATWSLLVFQGPGAGGRDRLLVGTGIGVFDLSGPSPRKIVDATDAYALAQSRADPARLLVGYRDGLETLRFEDGAWRDEGAVVAVHHEVRSVVEDAGGEVWLGTFLDGVYRLRLSPGSPRRLESVAALGLEDGLPTLKSVKPFVLGRTVLAATSEGLFRFDPAPGRFVADGRLRGRGEPLSLLRVKPDADGNLWLSRQEMEGATAGVAWAEEDGSLRLSERPFRGLRIDAPLAILVEDGGVVWMGGVRGAVRCEPYRDQPRPASYSVLLREAAVLSADGREPLAGRLPYGRTTVRFRYAAPRFTDPEETRYSVLLVGFDVGWSPWSGEAAKEFTHLPPGPYAFRVRARDVFGDLSDEAVVRFEVVAPWYRTWWAYLLYALGAVAVGAGVVRVRSRHLERENQRLEAQVRERTAELVASVRELEATSTELEAFSYSVSHDLQAPLRRIRGFSELLLGEHADALDAEGRDFLRRIDANAGRLRHVVDALLKLSRVTRARLHREPLDLTSMAEGIWSELAERDPARQVSFQAEAGLTARGDRHLVELVLRNLLENAWKFTRGSARGAIVLERAPGGEGAARFRVRDNGVGFDPRYADRLFVPFGRLHDAADFEGTGIGLATVQRIVHRHGGSITAEALPEGGASFVFSLEPEELHQ